MKNTNLARNIFGVAVLMLASVFGFTQTATTSTTLSAAVTSTNATFIQVASATGINAPSVSAASTALYIDRELLMVTSVSGTLIGVQRGAGGTRAMTHANAATVYVGAPNQVFAVYPRFGTCTAANELNLPQIVSGISGPAAPASGYIFDCFGGNWQLDDNLPRYKLTLAPSAPRAAGTAVVGAASSLVSQAGGAQSATTSGGGAGGAFTLASGAGGAGGSSSGTGGAGGVASLTAGAGGGTITGGAGGAASLVGGAGGAGSTTAGAGGAVNVIGGAAPSTAGTAAVGGVASVAGGAGSIDTGSGGTGGAGAAANLTGGAGGVASTGAATGGAGGAVAIAGGLSGGTITSGAGGAVSITGGASANGSTAAGNGGNVTLRGGNIGTGGTGVVGKVQIGGAVDGTKLLIIDPSGATTGTATTLNVSQSAARTLTAPDSTGGLPVVISCGSTGVGNQTCSPAAATVKTQIVNGTSTLSTNAAVITFASAFTSTTSYFCVANDITTRANPVQMLSTSAGTATITNTTGGSDVIQWICVGN